jgi:hypothetical protein
VEPTAAAALLPLLLLLLLLLLLPWCRRILQVQSCPTGSASRGRCKCSCSNHRQMRKTTPRSRPAALQALQHPMWSQQQGLLTCLRPLRRARLQACSSRSVCRLMQARLQQQHRHHSCWLGTVLRRLAEVT